MIELTNILISINISLTLAYITNKIYRIIVRKIERKRNEKKSL